MITNKTNNTWIETVVRKFVNKNSNPNIIIDDFDIDRIYLTWDGEEFDIRLWNYIDCGNNVYKIPATLYRIVKDEDSGHGIEISNKIVRIMIPKED